jgi:thiamine biosynthesis lipoprotein
MVSWRLRVALTAMDRARRITDGRFDASVLGALERIGEHGAELGGSESDGPARESGGERSGAAVPPIDRTAVGLEHPRPVIVPAAPLDTGGIGKGLALRWAAARAASIAPDTGFLLEAGGDMVAVGSGPGGGWQIGIEDAVAPGPTDAPPIAVVALDAGAISTSSVVVRNWVAPDGRRVHHLVDPRTGEPARTRLIAVTVAGPDPAWTEVWAKSLFIAGRERIGDEARARGLAAWWIDDAGRLGMTPEARVRCSWVAEDRVG